MTNITTTTQATPSTPDQPAAHAVDTKDQLRVLFISTFAFTVFFAVWVMFAIVGLPLRAELGLSEGQFALLTAIPIFVGSVFRIPVGIWTDQFGGRKVMTALLLITAVPAFLISRADSYNMLLVLGFFLGIAGTSFAAGIAWSAAWFPPERQGFAMGFFGSGNVGASITKLLAPWLITLVSTAGLANGAIPGGWRFVPFIYAIMMVVTAGIVWFGSPKHDVMPGKGISALELAAPIKKLRVWRFGYYYVIVFGAYVALSLWLPKYYVDVYGLSLPKAGLVTALFIFPASLLRPLGGWMSDKWGARSVTYGSFFVILLASVGLCWPRGIEAFFALVLCIGVAMGIGKASVYKYVPQYFPKNVGAVGGTVGMIGGLGGFFLPLLFAWAKGQTGVPQSTFYVLAAFAAASIVWLFLTVQWMKSHEDPHAM